MTRIVAVRRSSSARAGRTVPLVVGLVLATGIVGVVAWQLVGGGTVAPQVPPVPLEAASADEPAPAAPLPTPAAGTPESLPTREVEHPAPPPDARPPLPAQPAAASHPSAAWHPERRADLMDRLRYRQDEAVRLAAAREILDEGLDGPLVARALEVLAQLDPGSVASELQRLLEASEATGSGQNAVANAIRSLGHRAGVLSVTDLAFFYDSGSSHVRIAAAALLAARGDDSLALRFQEERSGDLTHEDPRERAAAVRDLSAAGRVNLSLLLPHLDDDDELVRGQVLEAVRQTNDPSLLAHVQPLLEDPSARVRDSATRLIQSWERQLERQRQRDERRAEFERLRPPDRRRP